MLFLLLALSSALWNIVHGQCVPNFAAGKGPAPCASVSRDDAVLKDIRGATHFLLIPTARLPGIESPDLLAPRAPNFFADAWKARTFVAEKLGKPLARDQVGVGINGPGHRSQDQLHLHVDCLAPGVQQALHGVTSAKFAPVEVFGVPYRALFIFGQDLKINPFRVLHDQLAPGDSMAKRSLMLVGAADGFYLVDSLRGGEALLDRACAIGR